MKLSSGVKTRLKNVNLQIEFKLKLLMWYLCFKLFISSCIEEEATLCGKGEEDEELLGCRMHQLRTRLLENSELVTCVC